MEYAVIFLCFGFFLFAFNEHALSSAERWQFRFEEIWSAAIAVTSLFAAVLIARPEAIARRYFVMLLLIALIVILNEIARSGVIQKLQSLIH